MIRGVSDLAESKDDAWRQYACHTAAAYVLALLQSGPVPLAVPVASKTIKPSEPKEEDVGHPSARPRTTRLPWKISPLALRLSLVLIVLLALVGVGGSLYYRGYYLPVQQYAAATATARSVDTVTARNNAIPAAGLVANNPYPPYTGTLQLRGTLQQNTDNQDWITGIFPNLGSCLYIEGAYHLAVMQNGQFIYCSYKTLTFSDFAYQAQVTIFKGGWGGLSFRSPGGGSLYYFQINAQGNYELDVNKNHNFLGTVVRGISSVIKTGYNQLNLIAVVAQGDSFDLYVNLQRVAQGKDATFSTGQIGVIAI